MNEFLNKLQKIRSGFYGRLRFLFLLDMLSIFSIVYAAFIVFNAEYFLEKSTLDLPVPTNLIPPLLSFVIAITGALLLHSKDKKINVLLLTENKYPELKERLRTAYDNREETNVIVESLKDYISEALNKVSPSQLIEKSKVIAKLLVTFIFITSVTMISLNPEKYSIPPQTLTDISNKYVAGAIGNFTNETLVLLGRQEGEAKVGITGQGDIFGKPVIAPIEGKPIDLTLYSGMGTGFEIKEASETLGRFIRSADFPVDVLGANVSDGGYSILIKKTEAEKKLIEDYAVERSKI